MQQKVGKKGEKQGKDPAHSLDFSFDLVEGSIWVSAPAFSPQEEAPGRTGKGIWGGWDGGRRDQRGNLHFVSFGDVPFFPSLARAESFSPNFPKFREKGGFCCHGVGKGAGMKGPMDRLGMGLFSWV